MKASSHTGQVTLLGVEWLEITKRFHCWAARGELRAQDRSDHGCNRGCSHQDQVGPWNGEALWRWIKHPGKDGHEHLGDTEA